MKILLVSHSILPLKGGSSIVTESLAKNFSKDELVVVGNKGVLGGTLDRPSDSPNFYYVNGELNIAGKGRRFLKFFMWFLIPLVIWKIYRIYKKEECNYIIGVYPTIHFLVASYLVSRISRAGFSSYFHNTYLENRQTGVSGWFARKVQPYIFDHSDYIFVMSQGMVDYYHKIYPNNNFLPLVHTFNEYPNQNDTTDNTFEPGKEVYDLVLIGNFNHSNIDATSRLVNLLKDHPKLRVNLFTHVPKAFLEARGIDTDSIIYHGFVSDEEFYPRLMKNDIAILTHGFSGGLAQVEYDTIFPTRTIPLLLSGLPIIAHTPPSAFITRFLKKNECAKVIDTKDGKQILLEIETFINSDMRRYQENAKKVLKMFEGKEVAAFLKDTLSKKENTSNENNL